MTPTGGTPAQPLHRSVDFGVRWVESARSGPGVRAGPPPGNPGTDATRDRTRTKAEWAMSGQEQDLARACLDQ